MGWVAGAAWLLPPNHWLPRRPLLGRTHPAASALTATCSSHSPCCHGRVICFSVYAGPEVHFGEAPPAAGAPRRSMLWVDTWLDGSEARQEEATAIIEAFRPFWESEQLKKVKGGWLIQGAAACLVAGRLSWAVVPWAACTLARSADAFCLQEQGLQLPLYPPPSPLHSPQVWHNYSFDRHVMERLGLRMRGFGGDTMHMARLWDSSRMGRGGYSLEALSSEPSCCCGWLLLFSLLLLLLAAWWCTWWGRCPAAAAADLVAMPSHLLPPAECLRCSLPRLPARCAGDQQLMGNGSSQEDIRGKVSMKKLFGRRNIKKDGTEGKVGGAWKGVGWQGGRGRLAWRVPRAGRTAALLLGCVWAVAGSVRQQVDRVFACAMIGQHSNAWLTHASPLSHPPPLVTAGGAAAGARAAAGRGDALALGQLLRL